MKFYEYDYDTFPEMPDGLYLGYDGDDEVFVDKDDHVLYRVVEHWIETGDGEEYWIDIRNPNPGELGFRTISPVDANLFIVIPVSPDREAGGE